MIFEESNFAKIVEPYVLKCRPGDWEHAKRVVKWVKELGDDRGDLYLLIIAGYIHDIGWMGLLQNDKITFDELLSLEPQANSNSGRLIDEVLKIANFSIDEITTVKRLVSAADKHESSADDEAVIVDADQLSKLNIDHLKDKYEKSEWSRMYELWNRDFDRRLKTEKARMLVPELMANFKISLDNNL
jgi:hypothetical protein